MIWRTGHHQLTGVRSTWSLYALGVLVHVVMLALISAVPGGAGFRAFPLVGPPILIVYPLVTVALGLLLRQRQERDVVLARLREHGDPALVEWLSNSGAAMWPKPYSPPELVKAATAAVTGSTAPRTR